MNILEKLPRSTNECRIVGQEEECPEQRMKVSVTDAMAEVQSLDKPEQIRNCSHRADHFVSRIFEKYGDSDEIRLIFDMYDIPASLKQATRLMKNWFYQTKGDRLNYHRERFIKLTFRALALRHSL